MKIDDLALKKRPFYRQENRVFFHSYAILLYFDIFRKSYVIVQEIPSSLTTFFPFSVSATQSAGIMSAVEELFFWRLRRQRISRLDLNTFLLKNYVI